MTIRRTALIGLACLVGAAASANAADMYTGLGSMKDGGYAPAEMSRFYIRGDGGYAWHDDPDMIEDSTFVLENGSIDATWTAGGGIGVYFSESFRGDITADWRTDTGVHADNTDAVVGGPRDFDISSTVVLANLYYDINTGHSIMPYVGVGLGWASHRTHEGFATVGVAPAIIEAATASDLAAAFMIGFAKDISTGLKLDVGYRYLYMGDANTGEIVGGVGSGDPVIEDITAHELRVGLRYDIW